MQPIDTTTRKLLRDPEKRRAWVIFQLLLQGKTLAGLARAAKVERQTLYHAFQRPYPRMEGVISSALGLKPQDLFSERYDKDGLPKRRKGIGNGNGRKGTRSGVKASCHGGKNKPIREVRNTQPAEVA